MVRPWVGHGESDNLLLLIFIYFRSEMSSLMHFIFSAIVWMHVPEPPVEKTRSWAACISTLPLSISING